MKFNNDTWPKMKNKQAGFSVPDGYFDLGYNNLKNIPKQALQIESAFNGFQVPPSYFCQNKQQLVAKISKPTKTVWYAKFTYITGIAAIFIAILGLVFWPTAIVEQPEINFNQISDAEIIEHLSEEDLNEKLLCDAGWCQELNDLNKTNEHENYLLESDQFENIIETI